MDKANPYIIRSIQLDELHQAEPAQPEPTLRYYFSYWWKKIPLGHLFVEQHEWDDAKISRQKVWAAIAPAIQFYQMKMGIWAEDIDVSFKMYREK